MHFTGYLSRVLASAAAAVVACTILAPAASAKPVTPGVYAKAYNVQLKTVTPTRKLSATRIHYKEVTNAGVLVLETEFSVNKDGSRIGYYTMNGTTRRFICLSSTDCYLKKSKRKWISIGEEPVSARMAALASQTRTTRTMVSSLQGAVTGVAGSTLTMQLNGIVTKTVFKSGGMTVYKFGEYLDGRTALVIRPIKKFEVRLPVKAIVVPYL